MFTQLKRLEDGRRIKILVHCERPQKYPYSVQVVELYKYNELAVENKTYSFESLAEAKEFYAKAFEVLTLAQRIEKAEGILRRIKRKIYDFENTHDDFAPENWIKAERKVRRWLDRHIPRKAVERRDVLDVYYL